MRNKDGTFQEDIQCILEPTNGQGAIFISNIEAAANPHTLLSTLHSIQSTASAQSSLPRVVKT
jgi:hypothetical protein